MALMQLGSTHGSADHQSKGGVGAVGKWPAAATATSLAAAGHLSTAVVIADLRLGFGRQTDQPNRRTDDDRRDDEPAYAAGEELGRRFAARDGGVCRAAADGAGGREP